MSPAPTTFRLTATATVDCDINVADLSDFH